MSRINAVDTVVCELCQRMGLQERPLDDQGVLTLRFNELPVTLAYGREQLEVLWLHVDLGEIPKEGAAATNFLLKLSFECWCLNRMTIGLDSTGHRVWGSSCIPVRHLTCLALEQLLETMLEVAVPIRTRILSRDFALPDSNAMSDPIQVHPYSGDGTASMVLRV